MSLFDINSNSFGQLVLNKVITHNHRNDIQVALANKAFK